jgi:hypothetical protein
MVNLGPMPFYMGQLITTLVWSASNIICILGCCISLIKMLFVTNFDLIFEQNPESLGRKLFCLSLLAGAVPNCLICIHSLAQGTIVTPAAAYYVGEKWNGTNIVPMQLYGAIWFMIGIVMLGTSVVFIPYYSKIH